MTGSQRSLFAKGLVDLGNIVAGALVFGQFISEDRFHVGVFIIGIIVTGTLYLGGYGFSKERTRS